LSVTPISDFRADLHIHSHCSDGTDSPLSLLEMAHQAQLSGLSITDHDTIQAYTPELSDAARLMGLQLLRGVEISSEWQGLTVHVLAYAFKDSLQGFINEVQKRRQERNRQILAKLRKRGILVLEEEIYAHGSSQVIGRSHIAAIMLKKKVVASIRQAYDLYLSDTSYCYAPGGQFTPHEVVQAIHQSGGFAILAHPHFFKKGWLLREILSVSFDGLEGYYGRLTPKQEMKWIRIARDRNILVTGGSDYHGQNCPHISIGCSWVGKDVFLKLSAGR
jgi:predicted metal-dependent phosphoesterase TrpH